MFIHRCLTAFGDDYFAANNIVETRIPAGSTNGYSVCIDLEDYILDDDIVEGVENFNVAILNTTSPLTLMQGGVAEVLIMSKDGKQSCLYNYNVND